MQPLSILTVPQFGVTVNLFYQGTSYLPYEMYKGGQLLFQGADFKASPLHGIETIDAAFDLLSFLTCQPGDTDSEYFESYTPAQMQWANSYECEQLKGLVQDAEDANSEYHSEAFQQFHHEIA